MDHFIGFDQLLRCLLGREKRIGLFGPSGLIDAVAHKLAAYSWNLVGALEGDLILSVTEMAEDGELTSAQFSSRHGFVREDAARSRCHGGVLIDEPAFKVRAVTLDHGIPSLAFALEERAHINVWRNRVEDLGLIVGPWLNGFKKAILDQRPDTWLIDVAWRDAQAPGRPARVPLGQLKPQIMQVTQGRKIVYVVDTAFTETNKDRIVALAQGAELLFIEATFLEEDAERALARRHLTAHMAGTLARMAGVRRLATFHHSPRYRGRRESLVAEAERAFRAEPAPEWPRPSQE
jgi:ribonuclease Z